MLYHLSMVEDIYPKTKVSIMMPAGQSTVGFVGGEFFPFQGKTIVPLLRKIEDEARTWLRKNIDIPNTTSVKYTAVLYDPETGFTGVVPGGFRLLHDVTGLIPPHLYQEGSPLQDIMAVTRVLLGNGLNVIDPKREMSNFDHPMIFEVRIAIFRDTITTEAQ